MDEPVIPPLPEGDDAHLADYVDAYVHGVLPIADGARVVKHCKACSACNEALEQARRRSAALKDLPPAEPSAELLDKTEQAIIRHRSPVQKLVGYTAVGLAASFVLLLLATAIVSGELFQPSSDDLIVIGPSEVSAGTDASLRVALVHHQSRKAIAGIPVEIKLADRSKHRSTVLASFQTDEFGTGSPQFTWPEWDDGDYELKVEAKTAWSPERIARTVKLVRACQVVVTSDKPVYQPGQTIRLRSLALRSPDRIPLAEQAAVFTVTDSKGNVILRDQQKTSKFGIAAIDCPLAYEIIEGDYRLACTVGPATSEITVEIKKYQLPKFKIAVATHKSFYQMKETIEGRINATYFFGKPVAAGTAEVVARLPQGDGQHELARRTVRLDSAGAGKFSIPIAVPFDLPRKETVSLDVALRDTAGQSASVSVPVIVAKEAISIDVIPEGKNIVPGTQNRIYIMTTYADGRPAPTKLTIRQQRPTSRGIKGALATIGPIETDSLGVAVIDVDGSLWGDDELSWSVDCSDAAGVTATTNVEIPAWQSLADFLIRTDKVNYRSGETIHLSVLGIGYEPVYLDVIKDRQMLQTTAVAMKGGKGEYELVLPQDVFGTIELIASRWGAGNKKSRQRRLIQVDWARNLKLSVNAGRAEYRPGESGTIGVQVADESGASVVGAVSLAVVDEAVFSVPRSENAGRLESWQIEKSALGSVGLARASSVSRSASAEEIARFDQALCAFASAGAGSRKSMKDQLAPFLEGSTRPFEALDRPDWESLRSDMDPATIRLLRDLDASGYSASSYPLKQTSIQARQRAAGSLLKWLWSAFGLFALVLVIVVLAMKQHQRVIGCVVAVVMVLLLIGLMLPAVQSARETSRRSQARADLMQLEMAVEGWRQLGGKMGGDDVGVAPRLRQWFPETLYWQPEVITDETGRASVDVPLADSITTWRIAASAVAADGRLGGASAPLRVFQPFFVDFDLPLSLTRGDEVTIPVAVHNYLERAQTVELTLDAGRAFELVGGARQQVELRPEEVRSVPFRVRARSAGQQTLTVQARAGDTADAVKRTIDVIPDGERIEMTRSGVLDRPASIVIDVPDNAIEGSSQAFVRIHPSVFSDVAEGLDAIFRMPYGCFEQTSSTTYPNVLALEYLRKTGMAAPAVEAKARNYIHLGYQRLLGFEVAGGGFDWYGRGPANLFLTAYGLMEFEDMARVHSVDPELIKRTRSWLLSKRDSDGSWRDGGRFGGDAITATAYVAWALFRHHPRDKDAGPTREYLFRQAPERFETPYSLALACNALLAMRPDDLSARPYVDRLVSLCNKSSGGRAHWDLGSRSTLFYGGSQAGDIEATSLAALALQSTKNHPTVVRPALSWLLEQKDPAGTWHSTQATILALQALIEGTGAALGGSKERRVVIAVDGRDAREVVIPSNQSDVMQQIDLSPLVQYGRHTITLTDASGGGSGYQVVARHHVPRRLVDTEPAPLHIDVRYGSEQLKTGDVIDVKVAVENQSESEASMLIAEVPIPPGFTVESEKLEQAVQQGTLDRHQVRDGKIVLYLRGLRPKQAVELGYSVRALQPAAVAIQPAEVYEYYAPSRRATSAAGRIVIGEP